VPTDWRLAQTRAKRGSIGKAFAFENANLSLRGTRRLFGETSNEVSTIARTVRGGF
jgi:hypothetical protein